MCEKESTESKAEDAGPPPPPSTASSPTTQDENFIAEKLAEKSLDYFHESMNNEISRLWQRSIFLAGILGLLFAGYGSTLLKLLDSECGLHANAKLNLVCVGIAFLGVLFSALWIMMAKGSKAWQEKYEHTLSDFIEEYVKKNKNSLLGIWAKHGFAHGRLKALPSEKFSNCLFRLHGGAYSVSRINIVLGILSVLLCLLAGIVHSALIPPEFWERGVVCLADFCRSRFFAPAAFLALSLIFSWILTRVCKSGVIQEKQNEKQN